MYALPHNDFSLKILFRSFDVDDIITIIGFILMERKMIFVSDDYRKMTPICESLLSLIFPFKWMCSFVPVLPETQQDAVGVPGPGLFGIHKSMFDERQFLDNTIIINLDSQEIMKPLSYFFI